MTRGLIVFNRNIETYTICGINLLTTVIKSEKRRVDLGTQMGISNIYQMKLKLVLTRIYKLVKDFNLNRFDLKSLIYHYMMSEIDPIVQVNDEGSMMYTSPALVRETVIPIGNTVKKLGKVTIDYNVQNRYLLKVQYINTVPMEIVGDPILYVEGADKITYTIPITMPVAYSVVVPDILRTFTLWNMNMPENFAMLVRGKTDITDQSVQSFLSRSTTLMRLHTLTSQREAQYFIIEHGPISRNVLVLKAFDRLGDMLNVLNTDMLALITSIWNQIKKMSERGMDREFNIELSPTLIDTFPTNGISSVLSKLDLYMLIDEEGETELFNDQTKNVRTIASYVYSRLMHLFDIKEMQYVDRGDKSKLFKEEEVIHNKITRNVEIIRTLVAILKMFRLMNYIRGIVNNVGKLISTHDVEFVLNLSQYTPLTYEAINQYYESEAEEEYLKFEEMFKRTNDVKSICINFADALISNYGHISDLINRD